MNALIVCHAGERLGLGHLTRSMVVASALREDLGATVRFLIQGDPVQRDDLAQFDYHFLGIDVKYNVTFPPSIFKILPSELKEIILLFEVSIGTF